ncbi:hypothetical protein K490DRAFT_74816 [Saccharata proteae CBS 121410]|uniref:Uncharacterized protein n=1 Tax=Saccharata proteae CBS 121410 TaxID=1314787 RepID=A0A9P4HU47_9PEZI|nr:hypothetical protein K490DRAFT_74816 [Saccharata proteae CBS 121410]
MTFGPLLIPKALQIYRSIRASSQGPHSRVRRVPPGVTRARTILWLFAIASIILSLPAFAPENVFTLTQSRLQIPVGTLFTRLQGMRLLTTGQDVLTARDEVLRNKFASMTSRLLYLQYGPDVLAGCPFCSSDDLVTYFLYALPSVLGPHILHLAVLGLATSGLVAGPEGARWRMWAVISGVMFAGLEVWRLASYNHKLNAGTTRVEELDAFHWNLRVFRWFGFAIIDAFFDAALWLTSTNRWLVQPLSLSERLEDSTRAVEMVKGKLSMLGAVKNTVMRDRGLRERNEAYWTNEGVVMGEVSEEREVVEGMNQAMGRMDLTTLEEQAAGMADSVVAVMNAGIINAVKERAG